MPTVRKPCCNNILYVCDHSQHFALAWYWRILMIWHHFWWSWHCSKHSTKTSATCKMLASQCFFPSPAGLSELLMAFIDARLKTVRQTISLRGRSFSEADSQSQGSLKPRLPAPEQQGELSGSWRFSTSHEMFYCGSSYIFVLLSVGFVILYDIISYDMMLYDIICWF